MEDDRDFISTPHPWTAKRAATFLGTTKIVMSSWMQDFMDNPGSGFSVPWCRK
eukprot:c13713_g1_i1 orf=205-363(-)